VTSAGLVTRSVSLSSEDDSSLVGKVVSPLIKRSWWSLLGAKF